MAKNAQPGDGHRRGQVKMRSQVFNPLLKRWIRRNSCTGRFMKQSTSTVPFKGVRKEK